MIGVSTRCVRRRSCDRHTSHTNSRTAAECAACQPFNRSSSRSTSAEYPVIAPFTPVAYSPPPCSVIHCPFALASARNRNRSIPACSSARSRARIDSRCALSASYDTNMIRAVGSRSKIHNGPHTPNNVVFPYCDGMFHICRGRTPSTAARNSRANSRTNGHNSYRPPVNLCAIDAASDRHPRSELESNATRINSMSSAGA